MRLPLVYHALLVYTLGCVRALEFTPVQVNATGASTNWQQSSSETYSWYLDARLIVNGETDNTAAAKVSIGAGPDHLAGFAFVPLDKSGLYVLTGRSTADDSFIQNSAHFNFVASEASSQADDAGSTTAAVTTTPTTSSTTSTQAAAVTTPSLLGTTTQSFSSGLSGTSHSFPTSSVPSNSEFTSGFITSKTPSAEASSLSVSGTSSLPISQSSEAPSPTSTPSSGTPDNLALKIAIPLSIVLAILLALLLFFCIRRRKRSKARTPPFVVDKFVTAPSRLFAEDRKVERFGSEEMTVRSEAPSRTVPVSTVGAREDTVVTVAPTEDPALRQEVTMLRAELFSLREQMQDLVTEPPPSYVHSS
ncbi:hypothetical protein BDZ89DRAFT_1076288 [Hymenopellis radicata]|nr:hypothetical protein BDZ89DRAFT_1076288 [Hymenopellis radicata]